LEDRLLYRNPEPAKQQVDKSTLCKTREEELQRFQRIQDYLLLHSPPFHTIQVDAHSLESTVDTLHNLVLQRIDAASKEWGIE